MTTTTLIIGQEGDDERPINGHTAAHPATASELCINGFCHVQAKIWLVPHLIGMMISPLRMLALDSDVCPTPVTRP